MPQPNCPHCGARLFPHELKGGECTSCMRKLPDNITAERAPESAWGRDREPERDSPYRRDDYDRPSLYDRPYAAEYGTVRVGVNMIRWGMGILLALYAVSQLGTFALLAGGPRGAMVGIAPLVRLLGLAEFGAALVVFIGSCMCCAVPGSSQGAGWARGWIICLVATIILGILTGGIYVAAMTRAFGRGRPPDEVLPFFFLVLIGLAVAAFGMQLCFNMLLRGVARDFGDLNLGGQFLAYFVTSLIVSLAFIGGWFILYAVELDAWGARGSVQDFLSLSVVMGCVGLVVGLALFIWYLVLLSRLYNLLADGSGGRRYAYRRDSW